MIGTKVINQFQEDIFHHRGHTQYTKSSSTASVVNIGMFVNHNNPNYLMYLNETLTLAR